MTARARGSLVALATAAVVSVLAAAPAGAVTISQEPLPQRAMLVEPEILLAADGGLIVSATSAGQAFEHAAVTSKGLALTPVPGPGAIGEIVADEAGDLWYPSYLPAGEGSSPVLEEAGPAGVQERDLLPAQAAPVALAQGQGGAWWLADDARELLLDVNTGGQIGENGLLGGPVAMTSSDGALWVSDSWPELVRLGPDGSRSEIPLPLGSGPDGIAPGAEGTVWVAESQGGAIAHVGPTGVIEQLTVPTRAGAGRPAPTHLTAGPEGAVWFTDPGDDSVGEVSAGGTLTEYPIPPLPTALRIQAGDAAAAPDAVAVGPEGAVWFTEINARALGRLSLTGAPVLIRAGSQQPAAARAAAARAAAARRRRCRRRGGAHPAAHGPTSCRHR